MKIEVWSDFVCPFCYIGKRKLEAALEQFSHNENITVEYKSYELSSDTETNPKATYYELLASKFGTSVEEAKRMSANISEQAADVGLTYHFDTMQVTNTFDAHRLAKYAAKHGKGNEMTEVLLQAYFTDSKHIGDHSALIKLADKVGLNRDEVAILLKENKYTIAVREDQAQAKEIGVQGVPFFVFNEKYAISGAQPPEAIIEVLEKVLEEENEKPALQRFQPKKSETTYCCDGDIGCSGEE